VPCTWRPGPISTSSSSSNSNPFSTCPRRVHLIGRAFAANVPRQRRQAESGRHSQTLREDCSEATHLWRPRICRPARDDGRAASGTDVAREAVSIVAVNAQTGERRVFDRTSGVSLVDAMIATTASFRLGSCGFRRGALHRWRIPFEQQRRSRGRLRRGHRPLAPRPRMGVGSRSTGRKRIGAQSLRRARHCHSTPTRLRRRRNLRKPWNPAIRTPTAKAAFEQGKRVGGELELGRA